MTMLTSGGAAAVLRPEEVGALVVQPVIAESIALSVSTVVRTTSHDYRIPIVTADATAGWFAEGGEITPTDATLDELVVTPKKVAGLTIISRELADDTSPEAAQVVGDSLARDIAKKIDAAFHANTTTNGPAGLLSLTPSVVDTGATIANVDPFAEALSKAEIVGAKVTAFLAHPDDVLTLAKLKKLSTGSNEPLLSADAASPSGRSVLGVPLISSPAATAGSLWAIPKARVFAVIRQDATLDIDRSAYFSSDRVGVRATMRVGFGFPHPAAVVRLYDAA